MKPGVVRWMSVALATCLLGLAGTALAGEPSYIGPKKCKKCHNKQHRSWKKTVMAKAIDTLKPGAKADEKKKAGLDPDKDYSADEKCLSCHTTGYGKPGGFTSMADTPKMAGLSCESCHGPGSEYSKVMKKNKKYKKAEVVAAGLKTPKESCANCHNEKSPFYKPFDFEKMKKNTHKHYDLKHPH